MTCAVNWCYLNKWNLIETESELGDRKHAKENLLPEDRQFTPGFCNLSENSRNQSAAQFREPG